MFTWKSYEENTEQNGEQALTGEKEHDDSGKQENQTQAIPKYKPGNIFDRYRIFGCVTMMQFEKTILRQSSDNQWDEDQAENKGNKRRNSNPLQQ